MTHALPPLSPSNGVGAPRRTSPPDYVGAVRRRALAIVACTIIGGVIGIEVPYPQARAKPLPPGPLAPAFAAKAVIGASPGTTTPAPVAPTEIAALLTSAPVDSAAAQAAGLPASDEAKAPSALSISGRDVLGTREGFVTAKARTRRLAISLANAAAAAIVVQLNAKLADARATQLAADRKQLAFLQDQIRTLQAEARHATKGRTTTVTTSPALLQAQVNGLSSAYSSEYDSYLSLEAAPVPTSGVSVLSAATTAGPATPRLHLSLLRERRVRGGIGLGAGFLLSLIVVLLLAQLDRRLRSLTAAELALGLPVIGEIPPQRLRNGPADVLIGPAVSSEAAEAYRTLHWVLLSGLASTARPAALAAASAPAHRYDSPLPEEAEGLRYPTPVIGVASPSAEPTRSVVVANLAAAAAETGRTVIVLDTGAQPHGRRGHRGRGAPSSATALSLDAVTHETTLPGVWRAELASANKGAPLSDSALPELVEDARAKFDVVLVDAGGALTSHYAAAVARLVDGMAVVGELGWTTAPQADRSAVLLRHLGVPLLGAVLTQVPSRLSHRSRSQRRSVFGQPVPVKAP